MKPGAIASHRTLFYILIGLFEVLLATSILILWSIDRRLISPFEDAAAISGGFSILGLLVLGWLLRRAEARLARVCLLSALVGFVCSMILPAVR